jgi:hypothetical protein
MITQERLKEQLHYNKESGVFRWDCCKSGVIKGKVAGRLNNKGYSQIMIDGVRYMSHRLAWLYEFGEHPKEFLDHLNHIRTDNRIVNLRAVSHRENMKNQVVRATNKTGVTGVRVNKKGRFLVDIQNNYYGTFDNLEFATLVASEVYDKLNYHSNHGS